MPKLNQRKLQKAPGKPRHMQDVKTASAKKSWERKMKKREATKRVRDLSKKLREEVQEEQRRASESRKANRARKEENERKNMVVQKIKNVKAIKKLSPKHRKAARIFMMHEL